MARKQNEYTAVTEECEMKKYISPEFEMIEMETEDIITISGIVQSPDKPKSALFDNDDTGVDLGNIDPESVF